MQRKGKIKENEAVKTVKSINTEMAVRVPKKKKKWWKVLLIILAALMVLSAAAVIIIANPRGGKPWINTDLKMNISKNAKLDPKDDFHLYANYDWLKSAEIKPGYTTAGSFVEVDDETKEKAMALFTDDTATCHDADLIKAFYNAWLDWDARNALGVEPIRATVEDIQSISSIDEMTEFICDFSRSGNVPTMVGFGNTPSFDNSAQYVLNCASDTFLLQDPAEYGHKTITGRLLDRVFRRISVQMLQRLGYNKKDSDDMFNDALSLEGKLAKVCMTADEWNSPDSLSKINNKFTQEAAGTLAGNYPLVDAIEAAGYGDTEILLIYEPAYIEHLGEVYTDENLTGLKACMTIKYILNEIQSLDRQAFDLFINETSIIYGRSGQLSDEEYAYQDTLFALRDPVETCYLEKHDATESKQRVEELCYKVIDYYRQMLSETDWLSQETIGEAIKKLDSITVNVAYPEKRLDYSNVDLTGMSYHECVDALINFNRETDHARTNHTVEEGFWSTTTLQCNAYYSPQENSVNILLGILGGNYYGDEMSPEELYAGIRSVIGHEISHAFDTNGAQFDENGDVRDWWKDEDYTAFQARAQKLIDYYDGITACGIFNVKGTSVQTEAIADMAGMKCMLALAKDILGFDYDKFFRHYAADWRSINSIQMEYISLIYDVHPLNYLRTNVTLQQFQEFHDTYGIQSGDKMYLAPENRISVW